MVRLCSAKSLLPEYSSTEPWMSVEQIAERLAITLDSIYRWIERKSLPAHRVGRLWPF